MTKPKKCSGCHNRVRGHQGPTGPGCRNLEGIPEEGAASVTSDQTELSLSMLSPDQLIALARNQQEAIMTLVDESRKVQTTMASTPLSSTPASMTTTTWVTSTVSTPSSGPMMSSASSLAAQLAASNRLNQNTTSHTAYRGPNVQDLRADPSVSAVADQVLQEVLRRAPFLDPRGPAVPQATTGSGDRTGFLPPSSGDRTSFLPPSSGDRTGFQPSHQGPIVPGCQNFNNVINTSFNTIDRQFYPHMYASANTVSYADKITQQNINLPNFVYGYTKHLLSALQGRVNNVTPAELTSRMQNLCNIMQVVVINSKLSDFNEGAWQIGRDYANRINRDIEEGSKSWSQFSSNVAADAYVFAKDHVQASHVNNGSRPDKAGKNPVKPILEGRVSYCKDYNTKSNDSEHCSWELKEENNGKRCNRMHCCSVCLESGAQRSHRALNCPAKSRPPFHNPEPGQ